MVMSLYRMLLLVKVLIKLFVVGEYFSEYPDTPLPPETLGFPRLNGAAARPDYPPSTCCVRVVRPGFWWSNLDSQMIRGQGRDSWGSDVQWLRSIDEKTGRKK